MESEELRVSDTSKAVLDEPTVSGAQRSEHEAGLDSVICAGGLHKERKDVVRKGSAHNTQYYESCHWKGMDVDMNENTEEFSLIPKAVVRLDCMNPILV